jgi:hypothetical protein
VECKNCKTELNSNNFCGNCGAKFIKDRLTFKHFLHELNEQVFDLDNKLLKTFIHLITKPEIVISDYINGVRKRYINPFSFLLISLTISGISIYFARELTIEGVSEMVNKNQEEGMKKFMNFLYDYNSLLISLLIPIYALISYIVFLNKKMYNYIEHTIIYLYSQAIYSILGTVTTFVFYVLALKLSYDYSLIISLIWIIYNTILLKKLFNLNWKQTVFKVLYFLFWALVFYIIAIIIVGLMMFIIEGPEFLKQLVIPIK